jgi:hypothetical protein
MYFGNLMIAQMIQVMVQQIKKFDKSMIPYLEYQTH